MKDPTTQNDYQKIKEKAKEFYNSIGSVWCPILQDWIIFNEAGFQHLLRKNGKRRSLRDQERRFKLLSHAKIIIENASAELSSDSKETIGSLHRHGKKVLAKSQAKFWKLAQTLEDQTIMVIIRETGKGKHFFSIYDKKSKNRHKAVN